MPPDMRDGPRPVTGDRPEQIAVNSITRRPVKGRRQRAAKRREAITCRVSLLIPDDQRRWWHYLARCPVCGRPHLGRSRELTDVTGIRRLPCRHWVTIVVARTYGQTGSGAAA